MALKNNHRSAGRVAPSDQVRPRLADRKNFHGPFCVTSQDAVDYRSTVPKRGVNSHLERRSQKPLATSREAMGEKFPKHIYHSIVCIGALIAHREGDHWAVDAVGAPHVGERTEKQLITAFCDKIANLSPQLVTFNGNSFACCVTRQWSTACPRRVFRSALEFGRRQINAEL